MASAMSAQELDDSIPYCELWEVAAFIHTETTRYWPPNPIRDALELLDEKLAAAKTEIKDAAMATWVPILYNNVPMKKAFLRAIEDYESKIQHSKFPILKRLLTTNPASNPRETFYHWMGSIDQARVQYHSWVLSRWAHNIKKTLLRDCQDLRKRVLLGKLGPKDVNEITYEFQADLRGVPQYLNVDVQRCQQWWWPDRRFQPDWVELAQHFQRQ